MAIHGAVTQGLLHLILATLSLHASHIHGSSLTNDNTFCPRGWFQYDRFCVTRGQGTSERAVALYCDGFGGIGIKGICIIKVHTSDPANNLVREDNAVNFSHGLPVSEPRILQSPPDEGQLDAAQAEGVNQVAHFQDTAAIKDGSSPNFLGIGVLSNRVKDGDGHCQEGWAHYGSVCVYKPLSVAEKCHLMNSVEFHGLCVKHADTQAAASTDVAGEYSKEKRICCCASFKAKGNKYGC